MNKPLKRAVQNHVCGTGMTLNVDTRNLQPKEQCFLEELAFQRNRARKLLPVLHSIESGMFGSGKELIGGESGE